MPLNRPKCIVESLCLETDGFNLLLALNWLTFAFFVWITLELAYLDHISNLLPNSHTLALLITGLTLNLNGLFVQWTDATLGCVVSYIGCRAYHDIQLRCCGIAGIGLGDAKYLAALAAWFGIQAVPFLLVGASICSLIGYWHRTEKPFGVGLSISAIVFWIFTSTI